MGRDKDLLLHLFQDGDDLLVTHAREPFQEDSDRITCLQVVEQCLDRHTGAPEDRRSAHDVGVSDYDLCLHAGSVTNEEM